MDNSAENPNRTMAGELRHTAGVLEVTLGIGALVAGAATGIHIHGDSIFIKDAVKTGAEMIVGAGVIWMGYNTTQGRDAWTGQDNEH